ncbi:Tar ligand binding domain-containing protein, partial [Thiobacillus sp.]
MFNRLSIKARLIFILTFLSALLLAVGVTGLHGINETKAGLQTVYEDRTVRLGYLSEVESLMLKNQLALTAGVATPTPEVITKQLREVEANIARITELWGVYMATRHLPEEQALVEKYADDRKTFVGAGLKPAMAALRANEIDSAKQILVEKVRPLFEPAKNSLRALGELQMDVAKQEYQLAKTRSTRIEMLALAAITLGLGSATWIGFVLIRSITGQLNAALKVARAVADGDLSRRIDANSADEIGQLLHALKDMNASLADIVGQVRTGTDTIAVASREIASGNADLSSRTESQASSLEETASSMEEL